MSRTNRNGSGKNKNGNSKQSGSDGNKSNGGYKLTPQQIAVIAGLLANALDVESVLVDRNQQIQILLSGSLRRKTEADRVAEQLSGMSVGDLIDAFLRRY
jgi:hypothetical protein